MDLNLVWQVSSRTRTCCGRFTNWYFQENTISAQYVPIILAPAEGYIAGSSAQFLYSSWSNVPQNVCKNWRQIEHGVPNNLNEQQDQRYIASLTNDIYGQPLILALTLYHCRGALYLANWLTDWILLQTCEIFSDKIFHTTFIVFTD